MEQAILSNSSLVLLQLEKNIPAQLVAKEEFKDVIETCKYLELICEKHRGVGLAAPQVGINKNFFVAKIRSQYRYFINCEYNKGNYSRKVYNIESCLSLNYGKDTYKVPRWDMINVKGYEVIKGKAKKFEEYKANDVAFIFQHEIGHCMGELIRDIGEKVIV
jgi:peptide deformylase